MALRSPVVARQAATSGLSRCYPQGCRCGFARTSTPFCIHREKFQLVFKAQPTYIVYGQGNLASTHMQQNEQPLPAVKAVATQEGSSVLETINVASSELRTLNETPRVTEVTSSTGDNSLSEASSWQPKITSPNAIMPSAEEPINAAAIVTGTTSESSQDAANSVTDSLLTGDFKSAKEAYDAMLSGSGNTADQGSSIDALSQSFQSLADSFAETKSAVVNGFTKLQESIQGSVDSANISFKSTYDNINGSIVSAIKGGVVPDETFKNVVVPKVEKVVNSQESFVQLLTSPFQMGTPANNALKQIVTAAENISGRALGGVGDVVTNCYASTKEVLPLDAKVYLSDLEQKISDISGPVQSVLQQGYTIILNTERAAGINPENPIIPFILVVGGGFSLNLLYRQVRYGGYSGDLAPVSALDLLKKEGNVVLVDIRPEDLRESEGIPDLRRKARFKATSVALFKVQNSLQKMLKNTADAEAAITASAIKNLKNVQRNTKVILMDSDGSQAKSIARALKKAGIQMPYRIDGGFKAWEEGGLRVKKVGPETPLTIIKEETEAIFDEVNPTPFGIGVATLGVFAGLYALIEWEKTLQFVGVVCICQVLYTRLDSYESADDAKNDLKLLLRPLNLAMQGLLWAAGAVEPRKLQLATSPSTSAVQDRVLQAAAKHGSLPSEADQEVQDEPSTTVDDNESKPPPAALVDGDPPSP